MRPRNCPGLGYLQMDVKPNRIVESSLLFPFSLSAARRPGPFYPRLDLSEALDDIEYVFYT